MLTSEDEAATKWCPFVRWSLDDEPSCNRVGKPSNPIEAWDAPPLKCIASDCMAWRWNEWEMNATENHRDRLGYCGLAGFHGLYP